MAFLGAGDVKLLDNYDLKSSLKKTNKGVQDRLQEALGRIGSRQAISSGAYAGRVRGEYAPQELQRAGQQESAGIEDQLTRLLSEGSYDEAVKQNEHEKDLALAREIGNLNKGSSAQELLAALGEAGQLGGTAYGMYRNRQRDTSITPNANGSLSPNFSLLKGYGYGRYQ